MEEIYKYLDKVKAEMEKLQDEYQTKSELFECLKKVHEDQLFRFQEAQQEIEKKARVIDAQSEEISEAMKSIKFLTSSLHEKELSLKNLSSENEKLQANYREKLQKLEEENKEIVLALDEASSKNKELTQKLCASNEQIVGLKRLLLDSEKKCLEAEKKAQASEELGKRDNIILKLEQDNRNVLEQLKWKQEQFDLLEKSHEGFQDKFHLLKQEWGREKSVLLEEISSLQINFDCQIRISKDLQTRLEMCSQASYHEEKRRKLLEVKVSELESRVEYLCNQSLEEKSKLESITSEREEEIAKLRSLVAKKEALAKEMEYKISQLELKNWELEEESHKILQEAENINASGLLKEMHDQIKGLEQEHSKCFTYLKEREFEWNSQMEQLKWQVNICECEMKTKGEQMQEVQKEVESLHSAVEILNKTNFIMLMVLQSEFSEAHSVLMNAKAEMELLYKEKEDKISLLRKQLEMTNNALSKTELYLEEYHKQVASFLKKVELLDPMELQPTLLEEGHDSHKETVEQEQTMDDHKKIVSLEAAAAVKTETEEAFTNDKESILQLAEEEVDCKDNLQKSVICSKRKSFGIDSEGIVLARLESEQQCEQEKHELTKATNEEEKCTKDLQKQEQNLHQKLFYQELFSYSKEEAIHHQALLEAKNLDTENSMNQFGDEPEVMESRVKKLVFEGVILDRMKQNAEMKDMFVQIEEMSDQIDEFCCEDVKLMKLLEKILHICEQEHGPGVDMKASNELCDSQDKTDRTFCPSTKKFGAGIDERTPLKELNIQ
ncbi:uncharacterized protein At4g38062 [Manihot esculenta]|uniref:Uncharacterized protein n=1 Tax=Manihot esculenta TaxID=3983 RepID=A0A2C9V6F4_MANES|nr:uncharacterized protein At4g38062 [Manihot esculenta]OAY39490.1 hypothetical protein MANES_10G098500v8 [Manihot esculenta]